MKQLGSSFILVVKDEFDILEDIKMSKFWNKKTGTGWAVLLGAAYILTSCGGNNSPQSSASINPQNTAQIVESEEPSNASMNPLETVAPNGEEAAQLSFDEIVLKVGDVQVSYREVLIYLLQIKNKYEISLGNGIWNSVFDEGKTFEEIAKEEVINQITQIKIIVGQAEKLDILLADDELLEIEKEVKEYMGKITIEDQKKYGINEEIVRTVLSDNYLADKVFSITTNEVDTDISDEEAKVIKLEQVVILTDGTDKNGTIIKLDEEQIVNAKARAKSIYDEIIKQQNKENGESFLSIATADSDVGEVELTIGPNDKPEYQEVAYALKSGDISNVIETDYGYIILHCVSNYDEAATVARKEEIIAERQNEVFEAKYKIWSTEYKVTQDAEKWEMIRLCEK